MAGSGRAGQVIILSLLAAGACWTRYAGVTLVLAGIYTILFLWKGFWWLRIKHLLLFSGVAGLAVMPWLVRNILVAGTAANRQIFWRGLANWRMVEGLQNLWNSLLPDSWNVYEQFPFIGNMLAILMVLVLIAVALVAIRNASFENPGLIAAEALAYLAVTLGSMALVDSSILLDNRLVAPFYALLWPLMVLGLAALGSLKKKAWRVPAIILVIFLAVSAG